MFNKAFLLLILLISCFAYSQANTLSTTLKELDACIEKRSTFETEKKQRIVKLEGQLQRKNTSLPVQYQLSSQLYHEYQSYKYDSAYSYAGRMLQLAEVLQDPNLIADSKMAIAFSFMSAGLYKEASEISNSIDSTELQLDRKIAFYSFLSTLYVNMSSFSGTKILNQQYKQKALEYCDRCISLSKSDNPALIMVKITAYLLEYKYDKAKHIAEQSLSSESSDLHNYAIMASTLGFIYQIKGDTARAIEYLTAASIADLKIATKETSAIRQLAELQYKQGDVQRAYSYAIIALEDANFYNARQRKIEVGQVLPIIEAGRFQIIKDQKDKLLMYAGLISVLFILFVVATFIILKQKKRLNSAQKLIVQQNVDLLESNEQLTEVQKKISRQNIDLLQVNEKLKEAHHIKDEYIGYFFSANAGYLEKTEEFRKVMARMIRNKQFDALIELSASYDLRKEKEDMFALFDQIFMKIFPDFVTRYNLLFKAADSVTIKADGMLTPEIRIFALIRLGIVESERIAKFLDFSVSTVKNYKTKAKNRSIVQNELFEPKIMVIESVKSEIQDKIEE